MGRVCLVVERVNTMLLGVLGYVLVQLAVGMLVSRRIKNEDDYILGGRNLGYWLAAFTVFATWFGAETCISSAGSIYEEGLAGGSADPFGYGLCIVLMGLVFAVPLWKRRLTTLADLFRERYSVAVERLAVLLMVPTSIFWSAAQIRAFGQVLNASSTLGVNLAITLAAVVVVIYTASGGFRADVITDLIQGGLIIIGLVVVFVSVLGSVEDLGETWRAIPAERLNPLGGKDGSLLGVLEAWMVPICGSVVAQELVVRVAATRSARVARRATLIGGGMYLVVGFMPAILGLIGFVVMPGLAEPEQIVPQLAQRHLNDFFYILFAGGLVSAILSTVDSTLLAASSLVAHNIVVPLKPHMSDRSKVNVARVGVIVSGVIAYLLAMFAERIYDLVENASSFGSAGLFVIMVFGLFGRVGRAPSALAALIAGVSAWICGSYVVHWSHPFLVSMASAFLAYAVFMPFGKEPSSQGTAPSSA